MSYKVQGSWHSLQLPRSEVLGFFFLLTEDTTPLQWVQEPGSHVTVLATAYR